MGTVETALTTWEDFLQLPDDEGGNRYELQDGEVVKVPPPLPIHVYIQMGMVEWLTLAATGRGKAAMEFPYRPAANLQFWYADIAYVPNEDCMTMGGHDYPIYAPPLIIEVLSPSNRAKKIQRQRVAAFACGTREFWVMDLDRRTVEVSLPGKPSHIYAAGESVPISVLPGAVFRFLDILPN